MHSPNQQLQSPIQPETNLSSSLPGSRSASRPASRGIVSMLTTHSSDTTTNNNNKTPAHNNTTATTSNTVVAAFSSIEREEESNNASNTTTNKHNKGGLLPHRISTNREFVFSPSCAFDDISLGSQKSINSSRSSRTRVIGENMDWSSPSSTFSKHNGNVPVASTAAIKKTVYTTEISKKSSAKKN